jgi:dTDP-4-dehydrorhamnose reductase
VDKKGIVLKKTRILLLGATGMAGHVIYHYLDELGEYEIINLVFRTKLNDESIIVDVKDKDYLEELIAKNQPDYIINCIGVLINGANSNPDNAIFINSYLPHFLSKVSRKLNAKLIHISTDCVFSGKKGLYQEDSYRDADDIYGRSKALGEVVNEEDVTIRTSIIGPELKLDGEGLFGWLMKQTGEVNGFTASIWSGVTTLELAKSIEEILSSKITGLYHLTNSYGISKYELLKIIAHTFELNDVTISPVRGKVVDKSFIDTRKELMFQVPDYQQMIINLKSWMDQHPSIYN